MANTLDIEYILVPNTKGKSDLWKHFNLCKLMTDSWADADVTACKQCNSTVNLREAPKTCQHIWITTIPYRCLGNLWGTNRRPTHLSALVGILVFYAGMDIKYWYASRYIFCTRSVHSSSSLTHGFHCTKHTSGLSGGFCLAARIWDKGSLIPHLRRSAHTH